MVGCVRTVVKLDVCKGWEPITVNADEAKHMSDQTLKSILAHDRYGVAQKCWNAPKKNPPVKTG
jgi:hypothetical protein